MNDGDMTPLAQGAAAHHELYRSYVDAGFTEQQAFEIVTRLVVATLIRNLGGQEKYP